MMIPPVMLAGRVHAVLACVPGLPVTSLVLAIAVHRLRKTMRYLQGYG
jgi:hypothetical protein